MAKRISCAATLVIREEERRGRKEKVASPRGILYGKRQLIIRCGALRDINREIPANWLIYTSDSSIQFRGASRAAAINKRSYKTVNAGEKAFAITQTVEGLYLPRYSRVPVYLARGCCVIANLPSRYLLDAYN